MITKRSLISAATAVTLATLTLTSTVAPGASASSVTVGAGPAARCADQLSETVDAYVTTTHDKDAAGFAAVLDRDVTAIFADGETLVGKAATMEFISAFFDDPAWTQTFDERVRVVRGCRSAFVLWDSVFTPEGAEGVPLAIGVTFTYRKGQWLALQNQDSSGPVSAPTRVLDQSAGPNAG